MIWRKRSAGGAVLLSVCLAAGAGTAAAHTGPHTGSYAPVRGLVVGVSGSSLQVQASTGSVTMALGTGTHVTRVVNGSTADVAAGQSVELQLIIGTSTVKSIVIELARHAQSSKPSSGSGAHNHGGSRADGSADPRSTRSGGRTGTTARTPTSHNGIIDGQVTSATSRIITIRTEHGQTATYSVSSTVTVTKLVTGHLSDLAIGETVQVDRSRSGSAAEITILSS